MKFTLWQILFGGDFTN